MAEAAEARVARILAEHLHLEVPSADTDLFDSGAVDSLGFVELLFHLEREFGITITLDDLEIDNFRTIPRIAAFVSADGNGTGGTHPAG